MSVKRVLVIGLTLSFIAYADQKSFDAGQNAVKTVENFTSKGNLNQNVYDPLKSSSVNLKTVDNSKQGKANVSCPSTTTPVLQVKFTSKGNNEYGIVVYQDGVEVLNTDTGKGVKEPKNNSYIDYGAAIRMSGVCGNGVVYCNPYNSWNGATCRYFYWATDSSGKLILVRDDAKSNVGYCNCTNSSCGYDTVFYQDVVGSISGVLSNVNPKYSFSKGQWDSGSLTYSYYGTNFSNCSSASRGSMGITDGETYYKTQTIPDASSQVVAYQNDSSSPYYSVLKASNVAYKKDSSGSYTLSTPSGGNCEIRNGVGFVVNDIPYNSSCTMFNFNGKQWCILIHKSGWVSNSTVSSSVSGILVYPGSTLFAYFSFHYSHCDDDFSIKSVSVSGDLSISASVDCYTNGRNSWSYYILSNADKLYKLNVTISQGNFYGGRKGRDYYDYYLLIDYYRKYEKVVFSTSNSCSSYESKSDCKLEYEKICDSKQSKCVETVVNRVRKNNVSLNSCNVLSGQLDSYLECDFLDKITVKASTTGQVWSSNVPAYVQRRYICSSQDVGIDLSRSQKTVESMNMSGNTATFNDPANPKTQTINAPAFTNCIKKYCAVRYTEKSSKVYNDSTNASQVQGGTTRTYDKRECTTSEKLIYNSSSNTLAYTCPVSAGEEVLVDCSCESDIDVLATTAISTLSAIDEAVHDMICSQ